MWTEFTMAVGIIIVIHQNKDGAPREQREANTYSSSYISHSTFHCIKDFK